MPATTAAARDIDPRDIVLADDAHTDERVAHLFRKPGSAAWFIRNAQARGYASSVTVFAGKHYLIIPELVRLLQEKAGDCARQNAPRTAVQ